MVLLGVGSDESPDAIRDGGSYTGKGKTDEEIRDEVAGHGTLSVSWNVAQEDES